MPDENTFKKNDKENDTSSESEVQSLYGCEENPLTYILEPSIKIKLNEKKTTIREKELSDLLSNDEH